MSKLRLTKNSISYRKKCLNVLVNKGSDILPVQDVSQPAILTVYMHLVSFVPSRMCYVLWNKTIRMWNLQKDKKYKYSILFLCPLEYLSTRSLKGDKLHYLRNQLKTLPEDPKYEYIFLFTF